MGASSVWGPARNRRVRYTVCVQEVADGAGIQTVDAPETYRGYHLDAFQRQAISAVAAGRSVLVSAPTGTGKTLIADYLVEQAVAAGRRVVYTAPIKALSNQKFEEYCALCGEDKVGLLTGDVAIRPEAPLCIMTTEILRNQLITGDERLADLAWVVFDEIHYISSDRGIAWEESIILLPKGVRVLGLSATIGNLDALAGWMEETSGAPVERVKEHRRAVPLEVRYVTPEGPCDYKQAQRWNSERDGTERRLNHLDLVRVLEREDALPALYFVFSRLGTEERAREATTQWQFLDRRERRLMDEALAEVRARFPGARELRGVLGTCLQHGIGYHHAGMLPATKRAVEHLYGRGLIRLLYCTETFAVGVNYPVRAVALESSRKFDGTQFRPLTVQEFQQMTGRAGRRGKDRRGLAFVGIDVRDRGPLVNYPSLPLEPVRSQFFVTESTALNLLRTFGRERAMDVLSRNFREYQRRQEESAERGHLEQLLAERQQLWDRGCSHLGTPACPLERRRLMALAADYRRKRRQRRNRRARQSVDRALLELDGLLATPEDCPRPSPDPCRALVAPHQRIAERLERAEASRVEASERSHYRAEMDRVCALLARLGYIEGEHLLPRGEMARHLHVEPLLLTELIFDGFFQDQPPEVIGATLAAVDFDARHDDACFGLPKVSAAQEVERVARRLRDQGASVRFDPVVCPLVHAWAEGQPFGSLIKQTTIQEGDFIGAVRRAIDLIRQLRASVREDRALVDKLNTVSARLDRDEAQVLF